MGEKKSQYLSKPHHQALGYVVNGNAKQFFRIFSITSYQFWEKSAFIDNNLILAKMVKVLWFFYLAWAHIEDIIIHVTTLTNMSNVEMGKGLMTSQSWDVTNTSIMTQLNLEVVCIICSVTKICCLNTIVTIWKLLTF